MPDDRRQWYQHSGVDPPHPSAGNGCRLYHLVPVQLPWTDSAGPSIQRLCLRSIQPTKCEDLYADEVQPGSVNPNTVAIIEGDLECSDYHHSNNDDPDFGGRKTGLARYRGHGRAGELSWAQRETPIRSGYDRRDIQMGAQQTVHST